MMLLLTLALAAATPTPEAEALGFRLARSGTLATLLPLMGAKETEEIVAQHPELSEAERAQLREVAATTLQGGIDRLLATEGMNTPRRSALRTSGSWSRPRSIPRRGGCARRCRR